MHPPGYSYYAMLRLYQGDSATTAALLRRIGERGVDLAALRQASLDGRLVAGTIFSDDNANAASM